MRNKIGTAVAILSLTALNFASSTTTAQAAGGCRAKWPGRDGYVRVWEHWDCGGVLLGATAGVDELWEDEYGPFQVFDSVRASAVMNSGFIGGRDVVAFYGDPYYSTEGGYVCLSPYELYADNLTDNYFTNGGGVVNDRINSHRWVTSSDCAAGSWLT